MMTVPQLIVKLRSYDEHKYYVWIEDGVLMIAKITEIDEIKLEAP
jgi:hypothetical protein